MCLEIFLLLSELVEHNECLLPIKTLMFALLKYFWKDISKFLKKICFKIFPMKISNGLKPLC